MEHIDLEKFANGAFSAQVNRAIEEVTNNIQDPNTEPGATRKITVTIGFKPNQERNFVATGVQTKTTLAPALGAVTAFSMGKDIRTGKWRRWKSARGRSPARCPSMMFRVSSRRPPRRKPMTRRQERSWRKASDREKTGQSEKS